MGEVLYAFREGVATLPLNAREGRNAFTAAMLEEFLEACAASDADP